MNDREMFERAMALLKRAQEMLLAARAKHQAAMRQQRAA
jgi:hypothetical protein